MEDLIFLTAAIFAVGGVIGIIVAVLNHLFDLVPPKKQEKILNFFAKYL